MSRCQDPSYVIEIVKSVDKILISLGIGELKKWTPFKQLNLILNVPVTYRLSGLPGSRVYLTLSSSV